MIAERYSLEHIDLEMNHRCNLRCRHCSARAGKAKAANELSTDEIGDILARAKKIGLCKVGLTGGEPLYDLEKLESIAECCRSSLNVSIHTHTNGTLVTEDMCRSGSVLTLFESISVTFLGRDAETHDAMTGKKGSFDKSFRGAGIIARAGLPLTCYFIPTQGTCAGFRQLATELRRADVKRIRAMALAPSGRARAIYGETAPPRSELERFESDLLSVGSEQKIHMEAGYCTRLSMSGLAVLAGHDKCMSALNRVHINSKGDVFPCTAASGVKELKLGNLRRCDFDLEKIWSDSEVANTIRMIHAGTLPQCAQCSRQPKCGFGCTVNACGTMSEESRKACPLTNPRLRKALFPRHDD